MTLYAFDDIDDAIDATRAFLWPFDLGRWAKLALVMFFVGGGGANFNPFQYNFGGTGGGGGPTEPGTPGTPGAPSGFPSIGGPELAVILAVVGIIVLLGLLFLIIGSIMEFVFVESLRREAVSLRRYWGAHWGKGLRLFVFRLVLTLFTLAVLGGLVAVALAPILFGDGGISVGLVVLAIVAFVVLAIVVGIVQGFTTVFVVPIMIAEDRGLLASWRSFWPTMTGQWKQYAVYAVMGFVLQIAAGIVAGIVTLIAAIVPLVVFGVVGLVGWGLVSTSSILGWGVIVVAVALFFLTVVVLALFVTVPIQSFLRYYALFVLGDTNEAFDLIPKRRRAVREDDAGPSDATV